MKDFMKTVKRCILKVALAFCGWRLRRHGKLADRYMKSAMSFSRYKYHDQRRSEYRRKCIVIGKKIGDIIY